MISAKQSLQIQPSNTKAHPLHTPWYIYYSKSKKEEQTKHKEEHSRYVFSCESFLNHYHYLKKPSQLPVATKILFFRQNCSPCWENWIHSGCLLFEYDSDQLSKRECDDTWKRILFNCVGEVYGSSVIGVSLGIRESTILMQVWIRAEIDMEHVLELMQRQLNGVTKQKPVFKRHEQSLKAYQNNKQHLHLQHESDALNKQSKKQKKKKQSKQKIKQFL